VGGSPADATDVIRSLGTGDALLSILATHVVEESRHGVVPWIHYRLPESAAPMLSSTPAQKFDDV